MIGNLVRGAGWLPYVAAGSLLFFAGGQIIGGMKVNAVKAELAETQQQIINNAVAQAKELAEQYEAENVLRRQYQRQAESARASLRASEQELEFAFEQKETALATAAQNLSQCLLNEETAIILNDWLLYDEEGMEMPEGFE